MSKLPKKTPSMIKLPLSHLRVGLEKLGNTITFAIYADQIAVNDRKPIASGFINSHTAQELRELANEIERLMK